MKEKKSNELRKLAIKQAKRFENAVRKQYGLESRFRKIDEVNGHFVIKIYLDSKSSIEDSVCKSVKTTLLGIEGFSEDSIVTRSEEQPNSVFVYACFYEDQEQADADCCKEWSLADLVAFVKRHPIDFPNGVNTKISLGDFEGNTYHRKTCIGGDSGRLYLSYELNEYAEEEG